MEEKVEEKKNKKSIWKKIIIILLILAIIGGGVFLYFKVFKNGNGTIEEANVQDKIELYDYVLYDNVTEYYKEEFKKLKKMSSDKNLTNEEQAKQVAKLYVIDLFSINYKSNKYEVTSSQYFYSKKQKMHTDKVVDTLYTMVEDNYNNDRKQELPEVSNVEIVNTTESTYNINDKDREAYIVELKIEYVKDLGYDKHSQVTLVVEGDNLSVVNYKAL